MKTLLAGSALFFAGFAINVVIWRKFPRKRSIKILFKIFLCTFFGGAISLQIISFFYPIFSAATPQTFSEYLHLFLFFISVSITYLITYSAIEADSPTLMILTHLGHAGPVGLSKENLLQVMTNELLVGARVKDLLDAKIIYLEEGKCKLNFSGIMMARIFIVFRSFLNLPKGG